MNLPLRSSLIRLAATHPEFRKDLLPLLRTAAPNPRQIRQLQLENWGLYLKSQIKAQEEIAGVLARLQVEVEDAGIQASAARIRGEMLGLVAGLDALRQDLARVAGTRLKPSWSKTPEAERAAILRKKIQKVWGWEPAELDRLAQHRTLGEAVREFQDLYYGQGDVMRKAREKLQSLFEE